MVYRAGVAAATAGGRPFRHAKFTWVRCLFALDCFGLLFRARGRKQQQTTHNHEPRGTFLPMQQKHKQQTPSAANPIQVQCNTNPTQYNKQSPIKSHHSIQVTEAGRSERWVVATCGRYSVVWNFKRLVMGVMGEGDEWMGDDDGVDGGVVMREGGDDDGVMVAWR